MMRRLSYSQTGLSKNVGVVVPDLQKWQNTRNKIKRYLILYPKYTEHQLIDYFTKDWNTTERSRFISWMHAEDDRDIKRYDVQYVKS